MRKFYQKEWHGIYFKDLVDISPELPSKRFYDTFYSKFFEKYNSFDELDSNWVSYKLKIAEFILDIAENNSHLLSIGSGIGIVEDAIVTNSDIHITAIEPSKVASKWIKHNKKITHVDGYFPEAIENNISFDLIYANNIDYVFNKDEYKIFLKSIINYGVKDFLVITSANYNFKVAISLLIKSLLGSLNIIEKLSEGQFWGYLRTENEHKEALIDVGFKELQVSKLGKDTIIIRAKV